LEIFILEILETHLSKPDITFSTDNQIIRSCFENKSKQNLHNFCVYDFFKISHSNRKNRAQNHGLEFLILEGKSRNKKKRFWNKKRED
jgi:hypothetical protein